MKKPDKVYLASLPERTVRAATALATGLTSLAANTLLPGFLRGTTVYKVTFGMLQQFLIEKVAQVEGGESPYSAKDNYLARKTAGAVLEGIGLASIRFSPLWMLAILSDAAGGSKVYVERHGGKRRRGLCPGPFAALPPPSGTAVRQKPPVGDGAAY